MNKFKKVASGFISTALLFGAGTMPASADTVSSAVSGGALEVTTASPTMSGETLTASSTLTSTGTSATWTIKDARGTGAEWAVSVSATDFTSAAGSVETTARTIAVGKLTITPGTVSAGTDADSASGITADALTVSGSSQTLISAAGPHKGTYTLAPSFSLIIPANAFRSNYVTGTSGTQHPYISTVTYTIA